MGIIIKHKMKTTAAVLALIGSTNATYTFSVSVDERELQRTAEALGQTAEQWVNDNQDDLMPVGLAAKDIVEEYMVRGHATDNVRADALLTILDAYKQALYPLPEVCDETAFADCILADDSIDIFMYGPPDPMTMFDLFTTECATTYGCTAPCLSYDNEADQATCDALGDQYMAAEG